MRRLLRTRLTAGGMAVAICLASCAAPGAAGARGTAGGRGGSPVPGVAVPVPAEPQGFLAKCCAQIDACRRKLCLTPAGQMLNSMTKPLTFATGGIIPPFCPIVPSAADLAKPGVGGASDAIKKDALEAKPRREKVRFLGTVDCRYYPDAIGASDRGLANRRQRVRALRGGAGPQPRMLLQPEDDRRPGGQRLRHGQGRQPGRAVGARPLHRGRRAGALPVLLHSAAGGDRHRSSRSSQTRGATSMPGEEAGGRARRRRKPTRRRRIPISGCRASNRSSGRGRH